MIGSTDSGETGPSVVSTSTVDWDVATDVVVAGGGGCGLVAALAAAEKPSLTVTVLEKADEVGGNTALSTGMVPAGGTRFQREAGVEDSPAAMADDILAKNDGTADEAMVRRLCEESAALVHWLVDDLDVPLSLVDDFRYPGHSTYRMHSPVGRNGARLIDDLADRVRNAENIELLTNAPVTALVTDDEAVVGVHAGDRRSEAIEASAVILATDGFGGNHRMLEEWCDDAVLDALYFGASGNTGDGIRWGAELGGELACMDAYQGHATVAHQTGTLSTYAIVMKGGVLVNRDGERFGDESAGYSAFATDVLTQPDGVAFEVFDGPIYESLRGEFDDFDEADRLGAYTRAETVEELAETIGCDPVRTADTVAAYNRTVTDGVPDETGRTEGRSVLQAPFYGAKVTGALFHTQGGLVVDENARVLRTDRTPIPNLYAGGGTAVGISGHGAGGYLSGNGLTCALGLGRLAGDHVRRTY